MSDFNYNYCAVCLSTGPLVRSEAGHLVCFKCEEQTRPTARISTTALDDALASVRQRAELAAECAEATRVYGIHDIIEQSLAEKCADELKQRDIKRRQALLEKSMGLYDLQVNAPGGVRDATLDDYERLEKSVQAVGGLPWMKAQVERTEKRLADKMDKDTGGIPINAALINDHPEYLARLASLAQNFCPHCGAKWEDK